MKVVFKKAHLNFLKPALKGSSGRDLWTVARYMQENDGLQHQLPAEIMLLERGANKNDPWSMCELARSYFHHCGDIFLPMSLRYLTKAAVRNDQGAKSDLEYLPIYQRIINYKSFDNNKYKEIEMKCALLTLMYLHRPWDGDWNFVDQYTREFRLKNLVKIVAPIINIPNIEVSIIPNLTFQGRIVDGLAGWDYKISLRKEIFNDLERLIEVIFHELGHIVCFEIMRGSALGNKLKNIYGITNERILSWQQGKMGYQVVTSEEDPDTLSYGVYTLWQAFFSEL